MELGIGFGFGGDEIEEIPLRHEPDVFAVRGEAREIGDGDSEIVDARADGSDLLMGHAEEFFEQAESYISSNVEG